MWEGKRMIDELKGKFREYVKKQVKRKIRENSSLVSEIEVDEGAAEKAQNTSYKDVVYNRSPRKSVNVNEMDIAFIVPNPIKGSGGHRNIYRAVKFLHNKGHKITIYYCNSYEKADSVKNKVSMWFYDMGNIPFICYSGKTGYHDVLIATWWVAAYYLKHNTDKTLIPIYLVQDYESSFYPVSAKYVMADNTYRMGFSCICSGRWMGKYLINRYGADAASFQFPVNTDVYNLKSESTRSNSKKIVFFAKPEMPRRCYEIGMQALYTFSKLKPDVEIVFFGSPEIEPKKIPFKVTCKKLVPTIEDLAELYRSADLGLVFSTTNPSLVPYEMIACGCPVADIEMDMAVEKYGGNDNNVFLLSPEPDEMGKELARIIEDDDLLAKHRKSGMQWVASEFPNEDEMGKRVEELIVKKVIYGNIIE